jgi:alpha-L-fucosidase
MDIISKRGVLMLSFAPKPDGTFPEEQKVMMRELGAWLNICGEAVYATRPYEIFGEKPAGEAKRNKTGHVIHEGAPEDIRFTRSKNNKVLYATALDWPGETMVIKTFANIKLKGIKSVSMIGAKGKLKWKQSDKGLEIKMPAKPDYGMAYPVRIEFKNELPILD